MDDFFSTYLSSLNLSPQVLYSVIWCLFLMGILFLLLLAYALSGSGLKKIMWKAGDTIVPKLSFFVWLLGVFTYCFGSSVAVDGLGEAAWKWIAVLPSSIIHATAMFVGNSDISAVNESMTRNVWFMTLWNASHFSAIVCSMAFIIHQFGFFIAGRLQLWIASHMPFTKRKKNLYIFWGINEASFILAKSIKEKIEEDSANYEEFRKHANDARKGNDERFKEKDSLITFVRTFEDEDSHSNSSGIKRIFNLVKLKNVEVEALTDINCYITSSFHRLASLNEVAGENNSVDVMNGYLGQKSLVRLIKRVSGNIHIFMLGDEEDINIKCADKLICDSTINKIANTGKKIQVYCHARNNNINRIVSEENGSPNILVKLLDSSKISINLLKQKNVNYHPVSFADIDTTDNVGAVKSDFRSLIVGFGETGRDAFRFLYEFGAFQLSKASGSKTVRSPFSCTIVDSRMDMISPQFEKDIPGIIEQKGKPGNLLEKVSIDFKNYDFNSSAFYDNILSDEYLMNLNCVVISLGNDDTGMHLAIRILQQASKIRNLINYQHNSQKLKIFLRVFNGQKAHELRKIADHYNRIYGGEEYIVIFGDPNEIFSYDVIVSDSFLEEAKCFHQKYNEQENNDETWDERRNRLLGLNKDKAKNRQIDIALIRKLYRQESQDQANALHKMTKWYIEDAIRGVSNDTRIAKEDLLLENLAITEHLRWMAAHELMGYKLDANAEISCDERKMTHRSLVPWEELSDRDKKSDITVVLATRKLRK